MALLKSLIQRLLDSRTTPSEASHSSYPDDGTVTQFSPSATSVSSWTKVVDSTIAPSDGYVIVRGKATGESYVQITAGDNPPHMERSTFAKTTLNQYPILNLPIAKGKTFKVFAENTAEITVGLIKSIGGGGYNSLVRRALSCLRPSFNFSPKVFSKASILTLLTNVGRVQQYRTKTFREEVNKLSLPHLVVGPCFGLEGIMPPPIYGSDLKTSQERFAISLTPLMRGNGPRSRYRRVTQSLWILASTRVRGTLLLFATNRLNNLQTGGALC